MNIRIYSYWGNGTNTNTNNIRGPFYLNIQIFVLITEWPGWPGSPGGQLLLVARVARWPGLPGGQVARLLGGQACLVARVARVAR